MDVRYSDGQVIQIPDMLYHKKAFFSPVFRPPFKYQTHIYLSFKYQTSPVFRWLLYFNSGSEKTKAHVIVVTKWGSEIRTS